MYFPHAFRKSFLPVVSGGALTLKTTGKTDGLTAGQLGLFDSKTYSAISAAPGSGNQTFIIAQGSYFTSDKIAPFAGGYQESVKTKVINPKYVSRFFKVAAKSPQNQIKEVTLSNVFENETVRLRIDLKGSPALRFLSHNIYHTFDAFTGCAADPANPVNVDPVTVLLAWKDQINGQPIVSQFISAKVFKRIVSTTADTTSGSAVLKIANANTTNIAVGQKVEGAGIPVGSTVSAKGAADSGGTGFTNVTISKNATATASGVSVAFFAEESTDSYTAATSSVTSIVAHIELTVAYVDTKFGNCTFTVTDHYELEPLFIYTSLVDDSGDPCSDKAVAVEAEVQSPKQASGVGETVLRDLILDGRYRQEAYPDCSYVDALRMREIEANPGLSNVDRSALYDQVCILHNVPRLMNPTSTFDNDQYLLVFHVPTGTDVSAFTNLVQDFLDLAGNGVTLESF